MWNVSGRGEVLIGLVKKKPGLQRSLGRPICYGRIILKWIHIFETTQIGPIWFIRGTRGGLL